MNKKLKPALLIIMAFLLILTSCGIKDKRNEKSLEKSENRQEYRIQGNLNQYNINVEFNLEDKILKGNQETVYVNNEKISIDKIYFHLYPNAFKDRETVPFLFNDFRRAYWKGFEEGYIDIENLYVDGEKVVYSIGGRGDTILEVMLPKAVEPGEQVTINMEYKIKLPPVAERFGYGKDTYNFGNWYPVVSVYDEDRWNLDPYYAIGDPFYSDVSNYKVAIRAPKDVVIASSGKIISNKVIGDVREWEIEAENMRDFAWVASKDFQKVEKFVDGVLLKMYFIKGKADKDIIKEALDFSEKSFKTFNKVFGKYPYKEYSVVQTSFPSGMEYPGIVFIGKEYYNKNYKSFLETLIVHETAHQWWYAVVGNDQIDESWLDESFASYSEVIYYRENYGEQTAQEYHKFENEERYYELVDSLKDKRVLKTLKEFKDWDDYSLLVYNKGAIFLDKLRERYGIDLFYDMLSTYYDRYKFKIATTKDFLKVCEEVTGEELDDYFKEWLR
ncbi:MAG: hypothetical protein PWQ37_2757 [Candidatus Petromonas sp.]|nr:hypothetical protein [Candidatus Petromonas sp.]